MDSCGEMSEEEISVPGVDVQSKKDTSCWTISIFTFIAVLAVFIFLIAGRDYIKYALLYLEEANIWISFAIFLLLFTIVSFPMTWGYIILNVAAGYLYGLLLGIMVVMICAISGVTIAHFVIKKCLRNFVLTRLTNESVRGIMRVVESPHGFKVVILSRVTPIPFGLQNGLYAVSNISYCKYIGASAMGMFPSQGMYAYVGSTLRSMEEVISGNQQGPTAYIVFAIQLCMVLVLLAFILRKARQELNKTVDSVDYVKKEITTGSSKNNSESNIIDMDKVEQYVQYSDSNDMMTHSRSSSSSSVKDYVNYVHLSTRECDA